MDSMWIQWERICLLVVNGNDSDGCNHANHNCNCGRYDPIPTGHHSDCQLKQVIGHIWTGPTSQRQCTAFFKIECSSKSWFHFQSKSNCYQLWLCKFCETIISLRFDGQEKLKLWIYFYVKLEGINFVWDRYQSGRQPDGQGGQRALGGQWIPLGQKQKVWPWSTWQMSI